MVERDNLEHETRLEEVRNAEVGSPINGEGRKYLNNVIRR